MDREVARKIDEILRSSSCSLGTYDVYSRLGNLRGRTSTVQVGNYLRNHARKVSKKGDRKNLYETKEKQLKIPL